MKNIRRILCVALVAMFLCASALPAFAATRTFYLGGKNFTRYAYLDLDGLNVGDKVTDIKSSNKKIFKVASFEFNNNEEYEYADEEYDEEEETYTSLYGYASIKLLKKGSAKLTYKVNGASKSVDIKVLAYKNPVKSLVLTGLGNNNLKSKFAKSSYAKAKSKNAKAGLMKVSAASGWKITSAHFTEAKTNKNYGIQPYGKPISSLQFHVPAMKKGKAYYIYVDFTNTSTGASVSINYDLTKK